MDLDFSLIRRMGGEEGEGRKGEREGKEGKTGERKHDASRTINKML